MSSTAAPVAGPRIIVALDYPAAASAFELTDRLSPESCRIKVGSELFISGGPDLVRELTRRGFDVFLDLKFHDIPNTVAAACRAAAALGVWMLNVHAGGGSAMLEAAREGVDTAGGRTLLVGVTVLTSLDDVALTQLGLQRNSRQHALALAGLCQTAGLDGVVCSAREAQVMRDRFGPQWQLVCPGIRPTGFAADDQQRILTAKAAVAAGANFLVVGRPITQAPDPVAALTELNAAIAD